tara:strand:- start:163 stop:390 length:228 start_codon:yes stop_codon:yes gene_type:complete
LVLLSIQRHPIGSGDGHPGQMAGANANRMISAYARQQFKVNFSWCAGRGGLTSQFGGGGEAQLGGHERPWSCASS